MLFVDKRRQKRISKFLSYVLRHHPNSIGIELDRCGWVDVGELLRGAGQNGFRITLDELKIVVKENDKQRFSFSEDGIRIRANYGHSIAVDLCYSPVVPPDVLYHGTAARNIKAIRANGLTKGDRQYVHLSPDPETAKSVGKRHGKPIVLEVRSGQMHTDGYKFYQSGSKIWLTEYVPDEYLVFPRGQIGIDFRLLCCKAILGLYTFILSKPILNLYSYPFGLPRSEHKFLTARLFNIKARPRN